MEDRERQLGLESAQRRNIAYLAAAAGLVYLLGDFLNLVLVSTKTPAIGLLEGLGPALHGKRAALIDPRTVDERYLNAHAAETLLIWVVIAVGLILMRWPLRYLRDAEVARSGQASKVTAFLASWAPPITAVALFGFELSLVIGAHSYLAGTARTSSAISGATAGAVRDVLIAIYELGLLGLAIVFVLVSMRSMRVGLLTRVMGVIGIISGVLFVFTLVPVPLLQAVWFVGIAMTLLELGGLRRPPAWDAGEAIPWVKQQMTQGSARGRGAAGGRGRGARPGALAPVPTPPPVPSPAASKKRKRRRG
jgi:hypothetical protein